jgi:opacity protein-like surface antigen
MRRVAAALTVAAALAVPATADASSSYLNSNVNGAYAIKSGSTIKHFELYCDGGGHTDTSFTNHFAFSLQDLVAIDKHGKFSYSGYAFQYGNERQPQGRVKVKVTGTVTSKKLTAKWKLPACGRGKVSAART